MSAFRAGAQLRSRPGRVERVAPDAVEHGASTNLLECAQGTGIKPQPENRESQQDKRGDKRGSGAEIEHDEGAREGGQESTPPAEDGNRQFPDRGPSSCGGSSHERVPVQAGLPASAAGGGSSETARFAAGAAGFFDFDGRRPLDFV